MPAKVNEEVCIGCGACVGTCPMEAIELNDENHAAVNEEVCISCGACVGACPMGAIELSD